MKVLGIIAEYNPFHNGHFYHIKESMHLTNADYSVIVMSGNFTQRGQPALYDKWSRAGAAAACGADLVLELPFVYACNNAEYFSTGAVKLLNGLGCVTHLSFGSEAGNLEQLQGIALQVAEESPEFKQHLKHFSSLGLPFAQARQNALAQIAGDEAASVVRGSNNILAIEYLKQLKLQKSRMEPVTIKRSGADYGEQNLGGGMPSAAAIRTTLKQNNRDNLQLIAEYMPQASFRNLQNNYSSVAQEEDTFYRLIAGRILTESEESLSQIFSVSEGFENRLKGSIRKSSNLEELLDQLRTKRYARARINRILVHLLLNLTKRSFLEIEKNGQLYARVLAFNPKGSKLLGIMKKEGTSSIPVLTNINREEIGNESMRLILNYDIAASDLYNLIKEKPLYEASDFVKKPSIEIIDHNLAKVLEKNYV